MKDKSSDVLDFFRLGQTPGYKLVKAGHNRMKLRMCAFYQDANGEYKEIWFDVASLSYDGDKPVIKEL